MAAKAQFEADQYNLAKRTPTQPITEFPINSYVLSKYEGDENRPTSKLHTYWRGPFRVIKTEGAICTVQNLVSNKLEDIHKKNLKSFVYDSEQTDPAEIAAQDDDYYKLEAVLDHRFVHNNIIYDNTYSRGKLSELQLLVRYEGDNDPIWQEWSIQTKLNHAEKVHDYLRSHKLAKFVPAQYKKRKRDEDN